MWLMADDYRSIIIQEPGKRGGRPCIRGMRIAVADILGWLAAGMSHDEIIADYPELSELTFAPPLPMRPTGNAGS